MNRYSVIREKFPREIVLLKGKPCVWGRCRFCDYILDNSRDMEAMVLENRKVLDKVTGKYGVLEVINSGSVFELPEATLEYIRQTAEETGIQKLVFEAHWIYRHRLDEIRDFFKLQVFFKTGVETFDFEFRQEVLEKGADFSSVEEVKAYFDSPCLMVGIQGQTRDMVAKDIQLAKDHFDHATLNLYHNNSTEIKRDEALVQWFLREFEWVRSDPMFEVLIDTEDFGVTDGRTRE